jgi:hypothetical protein
MDATAAGIGMTPEEAAVYEKTKWSAVRRGINRVPYTVGAAIYSGASAVVNSCGGCD